MGYLVWIFLTAFGGGLLALLTPCVYSMIPITVSFFTKRSKTRSEGIKKCAVLFYFHRQHLYPTGVFDHRDLWTRCFE
jgi:thiol:disulfide interchange protein